MNEWCSLKGSTVSTKGKLTLPRISLKSPKSGKLLWWLFWQCEAICLSTIYECAQQPKIYMNWRWCTIWKVLQSQTKRNGIISTLRSPRISASSPNSGEMSVVAMMKVCNSHLPNHKLRWFSNTLLMNDMYLGCSLKGSTVSTIA